MCEYNRPYLVPFGQHPDDRLSRINPVRPFSSLTQRLAEMSTAQSDVILQGIEEAAEIAADVHFYTKENSRFIGLALVPSAGSAVKVHEH